ncbi:WD40/YVTN repeat-like-containing domain [Phytophthora cinnamomi]|uniref:WD40/YVTN repeat-like-containing domain n=1 Tax=Phytophthora cinnamomi TaxID=4785 RepID=UPI003559E40B|nr:WD40/YVTN repeat-like-containing domain [Phytophthora cinnamomi]
MPQQAKETLQLRHQLSASGLSLRAAAYDTRRHHVLTFDSHPLRPHALRLFSLRRELKSVPLFDKSEAESTTKRHYQPKKATSTSRRRPSFFDLQLQQVQHEHDKRLGQPQDELVVPSVLLQYAPALDVFVCVFSRARRPRGSAKVPRATTHGVALFEPATLRRLLVYHGPDTHALQCAHYDALTDRLVLASHLKHDGEGGAMLPSAPRNVVEVLQLSKRLDDRHVTWPAGLTQDRNERPSTLLFVENTRTSLRHPDTLALICASRGLRELYGAVSGGYTASAETGNALLEWRQTQTQSGGKFVLARRVMLRESITAMAMSPCGDWLLVGHGKGGLRVWNVNGSRTNGSALFTIDADPYEPTGAGVAEAQAQVISSIEVTTTPTPGLNGTNGAPAPTDVIVIAAERDTGVVRHWMFSVERKVFGNNNNGTNSGEHRYPRLNLVGKFDAGGKEQIGKDESPSKFKNQDTLGPPLKTLVMCVTIDMGSCFEKLLLVVREDVIHVLKVQTVLYVMQEYASIEEAYSVRAITQQGESKVISLSMGWWTFTI